MSSLPRPQSTTGTNPRLSTIPSQKPRQLSHLQSQLAQLTANCADLENLLRMTAVQAEAMRGLGGYAGGMWVSLRLVLGPTMCEDQADCVLGSWLRAKYWVKRLSVVVRIVQRHRDSRKRVESGGTS